MTDRDPRCNAPTRCPANDCNLLGVAVDEEARTSSYYSRVIGEIERDRVARWRCPDCGATWPRKS